MYSESQPEEPHGCDDEEFCFNCYYQSVTNTLIEFDMSPLEAAGILARVQHRLMMEMEMTEIAAMALKEKGDEP